MKSRLPLIKVPTLHIDPDSSYENTFCRRGEALQRRIPDGEVVTLPGSDDNVAEFIAGAGGDHARLPEKTQALN